jgi:peptidoglycan/xylan/chitin deacetylase (PgdA/CDA1 family)
MKRIRLQSLLPGVRRRIAAAAGNAVYLTFDDGPDPAVTPEVLAVLREFGARATFFLIGAKAVQQRALAARIAAEGHLLGNHSFTHRRLTSLSAREQLEEITRTNDILREIDGAAVHPFRPPYGIASTGLLLRLNRAGIRTEYWSVDSHDYRHDSKDSIARLSSGHPGAGDIVLMHDDHPAVLDVLRSCLPAWAARGFKHPTLNA